MITCCFNTPLPAHSPILRRAAALFLVLMAGTVFSQEKATIPYNKVAEIFDLTAGLKAKDKLLTRVHFGTAQKSRVDPVEARIQSKSGSLALKLTESGELVDFPLTTELRRENPPIISNQPKGTMNLHAAIAIKYSGKLTENVAWYRDALDQFNAAIRKQAGLMSFAVPKVKAIQFMFDGGTNVTVILKSVREEKSLRASDKGVVRVDLDLEGKAKDAQIIFSQPPKTIVPDMSELDRASK